MRKTKRISPLVPQRLEISGEIRKVWASAGHDIMGLQAVSTPLAAVAGIIAHNEDDPYEPVLSFQGKWR